LVLHRHGGARHGGRLYPTWRRCTLHIAGDKLEFRIRVARAGLVDDAHPGADIELARIRVGAFRVSQVVIGPPGNAGGLVGDPDLVGPRAAGRDIPYQRRARDQPARQLRQPHAGVVRKDLHAHVISF